MTLYSAACVVHGDKDNGWKNLQHCFIAPSFLVFVVFRLKVVIGLTDQMDEKTE